MADEIDEKLLFILDAEIGLPAVKLVNESACANKGKNQSPIALPCLLATIQASTLIHTDPLILH